MLPNPGMVLRIQVNAIEIIEAFLHKSKRVGFYPANGKTFEELCSTVDDRLFNKICTNNDHILYRFLPPKQCINYKLRKRAHASVPPSKISKLPNCNFLIRMLYKDIYSSNDVAS